MRTSLRLMAFSVVLVTFAGCGWMKARERNDYKDARPGRALTIPEGLDAPKDTAALTIPETAGGKNQSLVADSPPSISLSLEPIAPVPTSLAPDAALTKVESALRGTSGFTISQVDTGARTFKVTTEVSQVRRTWWSRITGRESAKRQRATRTVSVLSASGGGSAVTVQDVRGQSDAAARRILTSIRQALR